MEFFKKRTKNITLRHAYASSVSISGIQTNLKAELDNNGNLLEKKWTSNHSKIMYPKETALSSSVTIQHDSK